MRTDRRARRRGIWRQPRNARCGGKLWHRTASSEPVIGPRAAKLSGWLSVTQSLWLYTWRVGIVWFGTIMFASHCISTAVNGDPLTPDRLLRFFSSRRIDWPDRWATRLVSIPDGRPLSRKITVNCWRPGARPPSLLRLHVAVLTLATWRRRVRSEPCRQVFSPL